MLLIKLADRLHNMRTVFALQPDKREAVAAETRDLFCTLAERLGLFALKVGRDHSIADRGLMYSSETKYRSLPSEQREVIVCRLVDSCLFKTDGDTLACFVQYTRLDSSQ